RQIRRRYRQQPAAWETLELDARCDHRASLSTHARHRPHWSPRVLRHVSNGQLGLVGLQLDRYCAPTVAARGPLRSHRRLSRLTAPSRAPEITTRLPGNCLSFSPRIARTGEL